jgi:DNA-binding transcriptional regulator YdaS (Cro superfamily)
MDTNPLALLTKKIGSQRALAALIGVTPQAITKWHKQIPAERVLQVERLTGVSRHDLRSDLYPRESRRRS